MPIRDDPESQADDLYLPDDLVDRLSQMHDGRLYIPSDADNTVLSEARTHFGVTPEQPQRRWLYWAAPVAAAAAVVLGFWSVFQPEGGPPVNQPFALVGDADQSGAVDILDAFVIARSLDNNLFVPAQWDVTGDGRIDRDDVSAVTTIAVSLSGGTGGTGGTGGSSESETDVSGGPTL